MKTITKSFTYTQTAKITIDNDDLDSIKERIKETILDYVCYDLVEDTIPEDIQDQLTEFIYKMLIKGPS